MTAALSPVDRLLRVIDHATDDERLAARFFYPEARRFVGWLAGVGGLSISRAAGVVAALSPRNGWEANQTDAVALVTGSEVRSSGWGAMPRDVGYAREIIDGRRAPEDVLRGPKVSAFWRYLVEPDVDHDTVPVDRHVGRALHGHEMTEAELTKILANGGFRRGVELVQEAARLAGCRPIMVANLAWYVMRRLSRDRGQHALQFSPVEWRPIYPGSSYPLPARAGQSPRLDLLPGCTVRPWLLDLASTERSGPTFTPRFGNETMCEDPEGHGPRDRVRVQLGVGHPYANKAGFQWRSRLVVSYELGRRLRRDEHVDHRDLHRDNDDIGNLRLLLVEAHGRHHSVLAELAGCRDRATGRWVAGARFSEYESPEPALL